MLGCRSCRSRPLSFLNLFLPFFWHPFTVSASIFQNLLSLHSSFFHHFNFKRLQTSLWFHIFNHDLIFRTRPLTPCILSKTKSRTAPSGSFLLALPSNLSDFPYRNTPSRQPFCFTFYIKPSNNHHKLLQDVWQARSISRLHYR